MAIKLESKPNVDAPTSDYPFGDMRDDDGTGNGTPINREVYDDFHQFFAKMLAVAVSVNAPFFSINDLPDNNLNGFQLFEAFGITARSANVELLQMIVNSMIGTDASSFSTPYCMWGLTLSGSSVVGSSISPGYVYYNGKLYVCAGFSGVITIGAQFSVNAEDALLITDAASGGVFDYSALVFYQDNGGWKDVSFAAHWGNPGYNAQYIKKPNNAVYLRGRVALQAGGSGTDYQILNGLPVGCRPSQDMLFVIGNSTHGTIAFVFLDALNGTLRTTYSPVVGDELVLDGVHWITD